MTQLAPQNTNFERSNHQGVLCARDVAELMGKSLRWVYDHAPDLNGSKIGGSWFWTRQGVSDAIQRGQELAGDAKVQRAKAKDETIREKIRSLRVRKTAKKEGREELAERVGLADFL